MVETVENNNSEKVPKPEKLPVKNDSSERILVSHGSGVYDVTSFAAIHPGGAGYLTRFKNKVFRNNLAGPLPLILGYFKRYGWKITSTWTLCISLDGPI